jgi:hypothetical protein
MSFDAMPRKGSLYDMIILFLICLETTTVFQQSMRGFWVFFHTIKNICYLHKGRLLPIDGSDGVSWASYQLPLILCGHSDVDSLQLLQS